MKTLDQERAAFAWSKVQGRTKEYANIAKGAPALIMGNGLMQTLAFYQDKKGAASQLGDDLRSWICRQYADQFNGKEQFVAFMQTLTAVDSDIYIQVTEESLEFLRWLRQFAAAVL